MNPSPDANAGEIAADLFRREGARLVARLVGWFGTHRIGLAEDVVQEALARALQTWPYHGVPANPAAWLAQTARNLALDHLRREQRWDDRAGGVAREHARWIAAPSPAPDAAADPGFDDDTLRLLFVCLHPEIPWESRVALALRTLCGLGPAEIAAAFLSGEAAIQKRLVRARRRIKDLALPFAMPGPAELPARLDGVLATLYLLFNEGYKASSGPRLVREELCHEAIRLALHLAAHPSTATPPVHALLALMLLNAARLGARTGDDGRLVLLGEQDRAGWNHAMVARGLHYLALASRGDDAGEYHLQAGIAACHATASDDASTDWPRILALYDALAARNPSPVVALNRAVAVARVQGARAGLDAVEAIPGRAALESYAPYHAVRASLSRELGDAASALAHLRRARGLAVSDAERAHCDLEITRLGGAAGRDSAAP